MTATLTGLRRFNAGLGALHLAQGLAMLALASAFSLPVRDDDRAGFSSFWAKPGRLVGPTGTKLPSRFEGW